MTRTPLNLFVLTALLLTGSGGCAQFGDLSRDTASSHHSTLQRATPERVGFSTASAEAPSLEPEPKKQPQKVAQTQQPTLEPISPKLPRPPGTPVNADAAPLPTVEVQRGKPLAALPMPPVKANTNTTANAAPTVKPVLDENIVPPVPGGMRVDQTPIDIGAVPAPGATKAVQPTPNAPMPQQQSAAPTVVPQQGTIQQAAVPPTATQTMTEEALVLAMVALVEGRRGDVPALLTKYDPITRDFYLRTLPVLVDLTRKRFQDLTGSEVGTMYAQLQQILTLLRPHTELVIEKACFCEWIKSFGHYNPLPQDHVFVAAAPTTPGERVQLYVEVKNFTSEDRNGVYETRFSSAVEIHDVKGEKIWFYRFKDRDYPIQSRTSLTDYYNKYFFTVPNLPAGNYSFTITVADETIPGARREARKTVPFRVTSAQR